MVPFWKTLQSICMWCIICSMLAMFMRCLVAWISHVGLSSTFYTLPLNLTEGRNIGPFDLHELKRITMQKLIGIICNWIMRRNGLGTTEPWATLKKNDYQSYVFCQGMKCKIDCHGGPLYYHEGEWDGDEDRVQYHARCRTCEFSCRS